MIFGIVDLIVSKKVLYPVARRTESAALEADAAHLLTNVCTSFGVAFGLLLVELHRVAVLRPHRRHRRGRAHHQDGYDLVMQSTRVLLDETLPDDELERSALRARAPRRHHQRLPQAARAGAPAAAGASICTSSSTPNLTVTRHTTSPSTSRTTSGLHPQHRRAGARGAALAGPGSRTAEARPAATGLVGGPDGRRPPASDRPMRSTENAALCLPTGPTPRAHPGSAVGEEGRRRPHHAHPDEHDGESPAITLRTLPFTCSPIHRSRR